MFRRALLGLSGNASMREFVEHSAVASQFTRRFIAGRNLEDAVAVARHLNSTGINVSLDLLGESVRTLDEATAACETCEQVLQRIASEGLRASISVKMSQFGRELHRERCLANVLDLVCTARDLGLWVEFDMEGSKTVDATIAIVKAAHAQHRSVRAVIQAYLYRSRRDVEDLNRAGIPIRLCKGAYREPPDVAFPKKIDVDSNYRTLCSMLMESGTEPAIATHDPAMITATLEAAARFRRLPAQFEFQLLYGVRGDIASNLVSNGYRVRLYVPYGEAWYPYFMRRLAERPANLLFALRQFFRPRVLSGNLPAASHYSSRTS